jgi:hypothetical protein
MHGQHGIRRMFLATLVIMVALVQVGPDGANAAGNSRPDFGSREGFKLECELLGGTFSEDGLGNTNCHYPDGTWTQCDANGNDCWITPPRTRPHADQQGLDDVAPGTVTTDTGETSVASPETAGHSVKAAAHDQKDAKAKHGKGKGKSGKGKKRKK